MLKTDEIPLILKDLTIITKNEQWNLIGNLMKEKIKAVKHFISQNTQHEL